MPVLPVIHPGGPSSAMSLEETAASLIAPFTWLVIFLKISYNGIEEEEVFLLERKF
jgi:hypothetical protein